MFLKRMVDECDFTMKKYPEPVEGAWGIAQGATGRWCWVMSAGPEYIKEENITLLSEKEVFEKIQELGGWDDFPLYED